MPQHVPPATSATAIRTIKCPAGTVLALADGDVVRARGIRYATAERFAPPVAEAESTAEIEALAPAPACIQPIDPLGILRVDALAGLEQSEDCLRVSVTAPADAVAGEDLPVLVWIHGGAYRNGAADSPLHDPAPLVREQRVVVVTVGYRLGALGYLPGGDRPANLGLLDQREALRWVRRNIASFGGSPACVTVVGESAGADAALHLMITEGVVEPGEQLLHRVILQSAPLGTTKGRHRLTHLDPLGVLLPGEGPLEDLVAVDLQVLGSAAKGGMAGLMSYGVRYGHDPLPPADRADAAWRAVAPHVDLLAGTNAREVALYQDAPTFQRIASLPVAGPIATEAMIRSLTPLVFTGPTAAFVRRHQQAGGRARRYVFTWGAPGNRLAACHAGELPFLFEAEPWGPSALLEGSSVAEVDRLGRGMRAMWAEFARTGVADDTPARDLLHLVD